MTNSPKVRPVKEPMRMLGGSPMMVAVPPTLLAKVWGIKKARGCTFRVTAISMVTGITSSIVVTLSRKAEITAVMNCRTKAQDEDIAPGPGIGLVGQELEHAGLL